MPIMQKGLLPEVADRYRYITSKFITIMNEGFEWVSFKFRLLVVLGRKLGLFESSFLYFENKCISRFFTYFYFSLAWEWKFQNATPNLPWILFSMLITKVQFLDHWNFELPLFQDFCPEIWNTPLQNMRKQTNCNYSHHRVKSSEIWLSRQAVDLYRVYFDI